MPTTAGCLEPPLGNTRLQTCRLISSLLLTNTHSINVELAQLGTIGLLLVSRKFNMSLHNINRFVEDEESKILISKPACLVLKLDHIT